MEQSVHLSKNQNKKVRKQATKEELKKQIKQQEFSSSPDGKIKIGLAESVNPQVQSSNLIHEQIEKIKLQITKHDERIFNQGERIRDLMNCIQDQSNELQILRSQLIKSSLVTEQQLYEMSQSNFKQSKIMTQNKFQANYRIKNKINLFKNRQGRTQLKELNN